MANILHTTNFIRLARSMNIVNKNYVDRSTTLANEGLGSKTSVKVATVTAAVLETDFQNGSTIDEIIISTNDRILIKNQLDFTENGIYIVNELGPPSRSSDFDENMVINSAYVFVEEGGANADQGFVVSEGGIIGTDLITFVKFTGQGILDLESLGVTASTSDLNILDGVTASTTELNILDGVTASTSDLNILDGDTAATFITISDDDRIVYNDDGSMIQVAMSDIKTYIQSGDGGDGGEGGVSQLSDLSDVLIESNSMYIGNDPSSSTNEANYNIAVGTSALDAITTGDNNVAIGYDSATSLTTGGNNVAIGYHSATSLTTGLDNVMIGYMAGRNQATGGNNTAVGYRALSADNGGSNETGHYNTAIGSVSLWKLTGGHRNTAVGYGAGKSTNTGTDNVFIGYDAAINLAESSNKNVIIGSSSLPSNESASNNVLIGYGATHSADSSTNQIVIGKSATGVADNSVTLGNTDVLDVHMNQTGSAKVHCGEIVFKGDIIPDQNNAYDIGSATYKIKDLYVSDDSLWIGDNHKVSISGGKMKFRKRKLRPKKNH